MPMRRTQAEGQNPWPYDALVGGMPCMLADPISGGPPPWHEEQAKFFDQLVTLTAEDRSYAQWPPDIEFPHAQTSWVEGAGASDQGPTTRRRYSHTKFADASSGHPVKCARFTDQDGIDDAPVSVAVFNGMVIAASGNKLYKRNSDDEGTSWIQVGADLAGTVSGQMAVYQGTQATPYLFIPLGAGTHYQVLSAALNLFQHASQDAIGFEPKDSRLWLHTVSSNQPIIKPCEDGGPTATWLAPVIIGDSWHDITNLRAVADRLIVGKTNGLFAPSVEFETIDEELCSDLRDAEAGTNCLGGIAWNGRYIFRYGANLMSYSPDDGALSPIGPEVLGNNRSPIRGEISTIANHQGICLFATISNPEGGTDLARYGSWEMVDTDGGVARHFIPAWHFSQYTWDDKIAVQSLITSVFGGPRLYIFFDDGSVSWCALARTSNVTDDPNYEYDTLHTGELYQSRWTAGFPFEFKLLKAIGLHGRDLLGGTRTLGAAWRSAGDESFTSIGTVTADPGERLNLTGTAPAQALDVKVTLSTTSATTTPTLSALVLYSALRIEGLRIITATIKAGNHIVDHRGQTIPWSWPEIKDNLEAAMTSAGSVTVTTPSGTQITVIGLSYGHDYGGRDPVTKDQRWFESIKMVESSRISSRGTWRRLEAYTWGDLEDLTWADLRQL